MTPEIEQAFARHERVGFQFSGGRDSLAALYFLRPYWERMTVYHTDAGEQFPETKALVDRVAAEIPRFVRIPGLLHETRRLRGFPSDIVPTDNTPVGLMVSGAAVKIIDRYECCFHSVMYPMHQKMLEDGITLIVRGQRDSDYVRPPMRSGEQDGGVEVLYPIQAWNDEQVLAYLDRIGVKPAPFYAEGLRTTPECMTCTAWWDDRRAAYLKRHHPDKYLEYVGNLAIVKGEIMRQFASLDAELTA